MQELDKILDKIEELLEKENKMIIGAINDTEMALKLFDIAVEKQQMLSNLAQFNKDDIITHKDRIEKIYQKMKLNHELILSNLKFIEDLFEAVFETTKTYSPEGSVKSPSEGLINKKV